MNVREFINKNPAVAGGALAVLIAIGIAYAILSLKQTAKDADQSLAYFSVDDGKTYFADAYDKLSGFMKDGKPAYSVNVYSRGSGAPFVGFLRKSGAVQPKPDPAPAAGAAAGPGKTMPGMQGNSAIFKSVDKEAFLKKSTSAAENAAPTPPPGGMVDPRSVESYVKKPGEKDWHALSSPEGKAILTEFGPAAQSQGLEVVTP
ncbi:MAG: hypothetical protein QM754_00355 [Tepidisphaeraceae bacterium]